MAVSAQYLVTAAAIAAQPYAMIAYAIARRRRLSGSPPQRSMADTILGASVLAAIPLVACAAFITFSMGEPLLLAICLGFGLYDLLAAFFILRLIPIVFVAPTLLIVWAAVNLIFGFRVGNALFILPGILFFALAVKSIAHTTRHGRETRRRLRSAS
jgi:hypothetical protein